MKMSIGMADVSYIDSRIMGMQIMSDIMIIDI